ncbi:hypothetical protein I862_01475 [endosymbiont of Acanthamoeba sp. UWC8]|uniref:energy transducer TonB n=1 Tax=endosymbiont of Acanthamoeba sp. UWC8 TaxID=86106 RepID=UPI0004D0C8C6|nr:TonB C-terminal domain-containing protein [endosymbiont of Acanthamoeba sp. UWC8]AIF80858.1 hypothetical protein I862_01475 [endosymbiont of Acanthamoeba sp. UWC8]
MYKGLLASVVFHIAILCLFIFGLPFSYHKADLDYAIVVDMVDISEITNIKVNNSQKTKPKEVEQTRNIPKAKQEKKIEKIEPEAKEEPVKRAEDTKAETLPEKKKSPEKLKKEDQKKLEKEKKKREEQKKKHDDDLFAKSILNTLEEASEAEKEDKKKPDKKETKTKPLKGETNKEYNSSLPLSLSEKDFIRSQVEKHWNTTAFSGADSLGMQVTLHIKLDREGNVVEVRPVKKLFNNNPKYEAFVESTIRAVKMASPIQNLPIEKFKTWEEMKYNFDSSGMIY